MEKKELSVIIPSYLEEENLRIILPRLNKALKQLLNNYEILVVDTAKPMDNTALVCSENETKYVNTVGEDNYGNAIRTGIDKVEGEYTIFIDADGSHDPEFIKNLYNNRKEFDVVIASRYTEGGNTDNSKIMIFMSLIVNVLYSVILDLKCKDVSNSFKLYKTADLKGLKLRCNNFDVVEEILFKLKKSKGKLKIKEIPFTFRKRMFGNTKRNLFMFIISYIKTIVKLRFGK